MQVTISNNCMNSQSSWSETEMLSFAMKLNKKWKPIEMLASHQETETDPLKRTLNCSKKWEWVCSLKVSTVSEPKSITNTQIQLWGTLLFTELDMLPTLTPRTNGAFILCMISLILFVTVSRVSLTLCVRWNSKLEESYITGFWRS